MIRVVYYANQNVGVDCLDVLVKHPEIEIAAVVYLEKEQSEELQYRSVKEAAEAADLFLISCPDRMDDPDFVGQIQSLNADYGISVAWRKIYHKVNMDVHPRGIINFHGAYLPNFRGAVPTNWAIMTGKKSTGVSVHFIDEGMDSGPIILQEKMKIGDDETGWELRVRQDALSVKLMGQLADLITKHDTLPSYPQDLRKGRAFGIRRPEDGLINFQKSAKEVYNFVRALTKPYPGAFTFIQGQKLMIWKCEVVEEKTSEGIYILCGNQKYIRILDAETVSH